MTEWFVLVFAGELWGNAHMRRREADGSLGASLCPAYTKLGWAHDGAEPAPDGWQRCHRCETIRADETGQRWG